MPPPPPLLSSENIIIIATKEMAEGRVALAYCSGMVRHKHWSSHPERPERISVAYGELCARGLAEQCVMLPVRRAKLEELTACHDATYVTSTLALRRECGAARQKERRRKTKMLAKIGSSEDEEEENSSSESDSGGEGSDSYLRMLSRKQNSVYLNSFSVDCALLSAGCLLEATSSVLSGKATSAVALCRPPGHHATCCSMMGFCLYNNVALAVDAAFKKGLTRILIIDWDVHHGNGTQEIFQKDDRVLFVSLHRYDSGAFYPCGPFGAPESIGDAKGKGFKVNVGWSGGGAGDQQYAHAFDNLIMPIAEQFRPQLVLVSAGFDSARGDPLGGCDITPQGYALLLKKILRIGAGDKTKKKKKHLPLVLCLEGGYNCASVATSLAACVETLLTPFSSSSSSDDDDVDGSENQILSSPEDDHLQRKVDRRAKQAVARTAQALLPYWPQLEPRFSALIAEANALSSPRSRPSDDD